MRTDAARAVHTPLRTPVLGRLESWRDQAACLHSDLPASTWDDHLDGTVRETETETERHSRHLDAARVCATCPVRGECALDVRPDDAGIRAGCLVGADTCVSCGRVMTRTRWVKNAPAGTRWHGAHGKCQPCTRRAYRERA